MNSSHIKYTVGGAQFLNLIYTNLIKPTKGMGAQAHSLALQKAKMQRPSWDLCCLLFIKIQFLPVLLYCLRERGQEGEYQLFSDFTNWSKKVRKYSRKRWGQTPHRTACRKWWGRRRIPHEAEPVPVSPSLSLSLCLSPRPATAIVESNGPQGMSAGTGIPSFLWPLSQWCSWFNLWNSLRVTLLRALQFTSLCIYQLCS